MAVKIECSYTERVSVKKLNLEHKGESVKFKNLKMQVVGIGDINPSKYHPRLNLKPEDKEYENIKQSIEQFGYVDPLVWNKRNGNLVGGHQRYKIIKDDLKVKKVNVSVVDLNDWDEKLLNIALNKVKGDWHRANLKTVLEELYQNDDMDALPLSLAGFDGDELTDLLELDAGVLDLRDTGRGVNARKSAENQETTRCPKCGFDF